MLWIVILFSVAASWLVKNWMLRTYNKWGAVPNAVGANGYQVARHILDTNGLQHVQLEVSKGQLTDHYIPSQDLMRLSESINNDASVASIAVAAHECGHALQDRDNYGMLKFKAAMMPLAALGNQLGLMLSIGGGMTGSQSLMNIGLMMIGLGVFMPVLTLPIEFDASKRALSELQRLKLVDQKDYQGAKSMLFAAALTYVASAVSSMALIGVFLISFLRR